MTKLNRHYLFLLIAFGLIGPLVGFLLFFLITLPFLYLWLLIMGYHDNMPQFILELLWFIYSFGFAPALITGALIWALQLRRNRVGTIVTGLLGYISSGLRVHFLTDFFPLFIPVAAAGTLSALLFSRYLPRPAAAS